MKISGQPLAESLDVSGGEAKTTYLVRFQDLGSGRMTVIDCVTDDSGSALIRPPLGWGISPMKGSVQIVGNPTVIDLVNTNEDDGTFAMQEPTASADVESESSPPVQRGGMHYEAPVT